MSYEQLFLDHLDIIERVIAHICRRHYASDDEREEFRSRAYQKLITDDYAVLRAFKQQCSWRAYFTSVLEHLFLDYRNEIWGKYRPSIPAKRMGEVAKLLEKLIVRDRYSFDEAAQILWTNHRVQETRAELWEISERLPKRLDRRPESERALMYVADRGALPDEAMVESQVAAARRRACAVFDRILQEEFATEDRLILKLYCYNGMKQVDIARARHLDAKKLYGRIERLLEKVRKRLVEEGVDPKDLGL